MKLSKIQIQTSSSKVSLGITLVVYMNVFPAATNGNLQIIVCGDRGAEKYLWKQVTLRYPIISCLKLERKKRIPKDSFIDERRTR